MSSRMTWRTGILVFLMLALAACARAATPLPPPSETPTATATATVTATRTISPEEITAAATFIRTLPPSFTPTFTPSVTPTRNTPTPTLTLTPTLIPEDELCALFVVSAVYNQPTLIVDDLNDYIQVFISEESVIIDVVINNLTTGEEIDSGTLPGGERWDFAFTPEFFPDVADYEYIFSLRDDTRSGLCEERGTFDTREDEIITTTPTAAPSPIESAEETPEVTAEAVEVTAEVTEPPAPSGLRLEQTAEVSVPLAAPTRSVFPLFPPR